MGIFDKLGGAGKLVDLISNPDKMPAIVAKSVPGATHTLGRLRLLQEISARSALMANNCHRLLVLAMMRKADVSDQEIQFLNQLEIELLQFARALNNYPKTAGEMTLEILQQVNGFPTRNDGTKQAEGNGGNSQAGDGNAGSA